MAEILSAMSAKFSQTIGAHKASHKGPSSDGQEPDVFSAVLKAQQAEPDADKALPGLELKSGSLKKTLLAASRPEQVLDANSDASLKAASGLVAPTLALVSSAAPDAASAKATSEIDSSGEVETKMKLAAAGASLASSVNNETNASSGSGLTAGLVDSFKPATAFSGEADSGVKMAAAGASLASTGLGLTAGLVDSFKPETASSSETVSGVKKAASGASFASAANMETDVSAGLGLTAGLMDSFKPATASSGEAESGVKMAAAGASFASAANMETDVSAGSGPTAGLVDLFKPTTSSSGEAGTEVELATASASLASTADQEPDSSVGPQVVGLVDSLKPTSVASGEVEVGVELAAASASLASTADQETDSSAGSGQVAGLIDSVKPVSTASGEVELEAVTPSVSSPAAAALLNSASSGATASDSLQAAKIPVSSLLRDEQVKSVSVLSHNVDAESVLAPQVAKSTLKSIDQVRSEGLLKASKEAKLAANAADSGQVLPMLNAATKADVSTAVDDVLSAAKLDSTISPPLLTPTGLRTEVGASSVNLSASSFEQVLRQSESKINAAIETPVRSAAFPTELANKVVWLVGRQGQFAELSLNPPQMGALEVRLTVSGGDATAHFFSPNPVVREAIDAALPKLRELMAQAGLSLGEAEVRDHAFSRQEHAETQRWASRQDNDIVTAPSVLAGIGGARASGSGLVDLYV